MLHQKSALRLAAPVAVLALALTACGGGDDTADTADKPKDTSSSAGKPKASPEPESGGELATGESATGRVTEGEAPVIYEIVAQKADVGTEADAAKVVSDPEKAKGLVLVVAHVKYTHKEGPALTRSPEVQRGVSISADGTRGSMLIGAADDAAGCEDPYDLKGWKQGESHVLCETYLVPAGSKQIEVQWAEEDGEPYIWKFAS
ncbi:hypothetical protein [Streptomyces sp. HB132]|uniref:hypothetical protein n=1 Tax=Streptomyces sp. HB132 TaxID=767388 RepID=UPI0019600569|nr:hypothetical protein [Streptomyces sp. HB132]MBM7439940.1 hypothetical protein [Streptomyces sp. HB132]